MTSGTSVAEGRAALYRERVLDAAEREFARVGYAEARMPDVARGAGLSLATVYNTLHQFTEAGLLREVAIDGNKTYFDTNVSDHHHFFIEGENRVIDIPGEGVGIGTLPKAPEGMEIVRVDVVVRVREKR